MKEKNEYKDHFVSRTYLRQFACSVGRNLIHGIQKKDLTRLHAKSVKSICFQRNWSTIPGLVQDERVIECYIKPIEDRWPKTVQQLEKGEFNADAIESVAAYMAFLRTFTPTAIRLAKASLEGFVTHMYNQLDRKGYFDDIPKPHELKDYLQQGGSIVSEVDPDHPKELAIRNIENLKEKFLSLRWRLIRNITVVPFITSDNPCVHDDSGPARPFVFLPLSPRLAVAIDTNDKTEPKGSLQGKIVITSEEGVRKQNELIVKCAENLILFSRHSKCLDDLAKKFQTHSLQAIGITVGGHYVSTQKAIRTVGV